MINYSWRPAQWTATVARMRILLVCLAVAISVAGTAIAQDQRAAVTTIGNKSCGTWAEARREGTALEPEAWVLGYLLGAEAIAVPPQTLAQAVMKGTRRDDVLVWIDNYCQTHPLDLIIDAVRAFIAAHPH
jgi:hypothetical protein